MNPRTSCRASVVATVLVAVAIVSGCVADPPHTIVVKGGSGDSGETSGGDGGSGGAGATGTGAGSTTGTLAATTTGTTTTSVTSGAGGSQQQGDFDVSLSDATPRADLMDETEITVTVTPVQGFTGTVALSALDLPSEVEADFGDASLTLTGGSPVSTTLRLSTASSVQPGSHDFGVRASGGSMNREASGTLTVNPVITLHIPQGVLGLGTMQDPYMTAYGPYPIRIEAPNISANNPISIYFRNDDDVVHQIHASSPVFPHGNPIPPDALDAVRNVPARGTYDFYLHDQNNQATPGRIIIE